VQLTFDADVEAFRNEFIAFLDDHLPTDAEALDRSHSSSDVPGWARRWQRLMFENGWLCPGYPPEFGGRNASVLQQYVHQLELTRRRAYLTFNPQGVGIISASLISFGTPEQQQKWAIPILRADITASLGMSEPGAGSDLASLRTRAEFVSGEGGGHFMVNGQKVWTSGAHDADVLLTFVRTDPNAPKHKGISVLLIPTDLPGVVRRPFASVCDRDDLDFNEVFFNDVQVPAENLVGPLNEGWRVANGSLGHERNMLWLSYADRLQELVEDIRPASPVDRDRYATLVMDNQALRLMGSMALAAAARGDEDPSAMSVLKLFGSEASQIAAEYALGASGPDALAHPTFSGPYSAQHLDVYRTGWFERYVRTFGGTIAGGTSEIQRNIIAQRLLGLPRN
jgi:alkylation response protein AidB-like acyl-CoA dehydrogenase